MHIVKMTNPALEAEEGLLLGNGDLSVSIYHKANEIIWRFGKNDVWDRRHDTRQDPRPAHIDEIARGIAEEGWVSKGYHNATGKALRGAKDPKRFEELFRVPPSVSLFPYPCPKPVGELSLLLPTDQRGLKMTQRLTIEKGVIDIDCAWDSGVRFKVHCFIPPRPNVLVIYWKVENWNDQTSTGEYNPPVTFSLYRWADMKPQDLNAGWFSRVLHKHHPEHFNDAVVPLPPPQVRQINGQDVIEQQFYATPDFTDGFRYLMAPLGPDLSMTPVEMPGLREAHLRLRPVKHKLAGQLVVLIPTSSDKGNVEGKLQQVRQELGSRQAAVMKKWEKDNAKSSREFWAKSTLETEDKLIENVWYETLHARRCAYRADVMVTPSGVTTAGVAPGLAMPSTVQDFSLWHGDYHMNFNYQSPFWGDYTANHIEVGDAFFPGMQHVVELGRKLARNYWNCRGTFIQLGVFPFKLLADPGGTGSLCRVAYMTGWVGNHYWWRYLYTQDEPWLRHYGYPVIRDCALFYTDFLKKWDDGQYHAFPSIQGESFFTGNPKDYTDRPQVIRNARYSMQSAVQASEILGIDKDLRAEWQERLDHLVVVDDFKKLGFSKEEQRRYALNPPEFLAVEGAIPRPSKQIPRPLQKHPTNRTWYCSFNTFPWSMMTLLRNCAFNPSRHFTVMRDHLKRWRLPNGTLPGMSVQDHGYVGMYGESQGVIAPIQEMMLQSWDGAIRVFPAWPRKVKAGFRTLRAEGAFLVSAEHKSGRVTSLSIISEAGQTCRVANPFKHKARVLGKSGKSVSIKIERGSIICFDTKVGGKYTLKPRINTDRIAPCSLWQEFEGGNNAYC